MQERDGVSNFKLPGHPLKDTEYYKSPQELYKELQKLRANAYETYK